MPSPSLLWQRLLQKLARDWAQFKQQLAELG
jgi:hypothetical protein